MGAKLSDEERRLLILQTAYDQDPSRSSHSFGATGVISNVFNEMPDLVDFSNQNFRRIQKQ